jgi:hypothetical protein
MIYKTIHRNLNIDKYEPHKTNENKDEPNSIDDINFYYFHFPPPWIWTRHIPVVDTMIS